MTPLDQLLSQGRSHFQSKDYQGCMNIVAQVLSDDPDNTEAAWLMKEAQRQWEEQRSMEEFEIYVENLKKEAMDLFDQEQYEQCLAGTRSGKPHVARLCEAEPAAVSGKTGNEKPSARARRNFSSNRKQTGRTQHCRKGRHPA